MLESVKEKLADLVLEFGVNFQAGQKLALGGEPVHWDFINLLAKKAYERGAAFVNPELVSPMISIHRSQHQEEQYLDYVPQYKKAQIDQYVDEGWSFVNVGGMEDPDIYQQMNQEE